MAFAIVHCLFQGLEADLFLVLSLKAEDAFIGATEVYRKIVHETNWGNSIFILIFDEFVLQIFELTPNEWVHENEPFAFRQAIA